MSDKPESYTTRCVKPPCPAPGMCDLARRCAMALPEPAQSTRYQIADLYFWLGEEAERVGFTPWQTVWLARQEPLGESYEAVPKSAMHILRRLFIPGYDKERVRAKAAD